MGGAITLLSLCLHDLNADTFTSQFYLRGYKRLKKGVLHRVTFAKSMYLFRVVSRHKYNENCSASKRFRVLVVYSDIDRSCSGRCHEVKQRVIYCLMLTCNAARMCDMLQ